LPVNVTKDDKGYHYEQSSGGLASGLRTYVERIKKNSNPDTEVLWMGWPGSTVENEEQVRAEVLEKYNSYCVFFSEEVMENFYEGFCNKTIWPLFHYFPVYTIYDPAYWTHYKSVNQIFCDELLKIVRPGDVIWVHDYHLMLLPALIRKSIPDATIGFFLHIPFPSYEVFRMIPSSWRKKILQGLFGSDLIGFHTHDYRTYFLRSTLRILGLPSHMGEVFNHHRLVKVDNFPMGIDFRKFAAASKSAAVKKIISQLDGQFHSLKIILSIDRQDYSKGIINRLRGYEYFLGQHPEFHEKITLIMIVVPSRIGVENYQNTKSSIDELVGKINGMYGNLSWTPILYQYRSIEFDELSALYTRSDVALVTPLRDGMNLIAKEYVASKTSRPGVLILSEMAGAANELSEAIIINPNNIHEIGEAIYDALQMDESEQLARMDVMLKRIEAYDVFSWVNDFIGSLHAVKEKQKRLSARILNKAEKIKMLEAFSSATSRILFLDYDGTLAAYTPHPEDAKPGQNVIEILSALAEIPDTTVVLISGRDRRTLDAWFGGIRIDLIAEHGLFFKEYGKEWNIIKPIRSKWMKNVLPILQQFRERLPGSFVERKEYSLVFHYRRSEAALAALRLRELYNHLVSYTSNMDIQIVNGNKALEIRNAGIDKGVACLHWLSHSKRKHDFIFAAGDDVTDEDVFRAIPKYAYTVKVGIKPSYARFNLYDSEEIIKLLNEMAESTTLSEADN